MRTPKRDIDGNIIPPTDWVKIITTIGIVITSIMTTYMTLKMQETTMRQQRVEKTLMKVSDQSEGAVTAAKKAVAISAENLAVATGDPRDIKEAEESKQEYNAQAKIANQPLIPEPEKQ